MTAAAGGAAGGERRTGAARGRRREVGGRGTPLTTTLCDSSRHASLRSIEAP
jgi:hypothetical protein